MICCSHEVDWWGMLGPGFCFFVMWCSVFLLCQVSSSHVVSQIMLLFVSSHVMLYVMLSFVFPLCDSVSRHVLASCHVSSQSSHVESRVESCQVKSCQGQYVQVLICYEACRALFVNNLCHLKSCIKSNYTESCQVMSSQFLCFLISTLVVITVDDMWRCCIQLVNESVP